MLISSLDHHMIASSGANKESPLPVLMAAAEFGSEKLMKFVLSVTPPYDKMQEAAEVEAETSNLHYSTPLHVAARGGWQVNAICLFWGWGSIVPIHVV